MNSIYNDQQFASLKKGSRILFATVPADGHFNPLTTLALHLKSIGCEIRWYTSGKYQQKIERMGLRHEPFRKAFDISSDENLDNVFPGRTKLKGTSKLRFDLINVFILRAPEYFEDIRNIYQEFPFDAMIADITFGAIPFVREKLDVPVIGVGIVPLPETSKDLPPYGLGLTPSATFFGRMKQAMLRTLADKIIFNKPGKVMASILNAHGIDAGSCNIFDLLIRKSNVVLQSGTPGFEYQRSDKSQHIHFAGPLLPAPQSSSSKWFHEKLRLYKSVLLVTQGTVERDVTKLIIPTLEAFKNSDCLVIVATGGSQTSALRESYPQTNFIIEDYIPFNDVMPHADVYISNGGYGGVLMSIQNELPMVVAGIHEGKNEINARVGYFGLGINLNTERPTVLQIRKSVEKVLADDTFVKRIATLNQEFKSYDPAKVCTRELSKLLAPVKARLMARISDDSIIY